MKLRILKKIINKKSIKNNSTIMTICVLPFQGFHMNIVLFCNVNYNVNCGLNLFDVILQCICWSSIQCFYEILKFFLFLIRNCVSISLIINLTLLTVFVNSKFSFSISTVQKEKESKEVWHRTLEMIRRQSHFLL